MDDAGLSREQLISQLQQLRQRVALHRDPNAGDELRLIATKAKG